MKQPIDIKVIAASNPAVDLKLLTEALQLIAELQKAGIGFKKYDLSSPFSKRVNRVDDNQEGVVVLRKVG